MKKLNEYNTENLLKTLKYEFNLIKLYLQLSVTYSQIGNHEKALNCGKKCLRYFSSMINSLDNILKVNKNNFGSKFHEFFDVINKDLNLKNKFNDFLDFGKKIGFYLQNVLLSFDQKNSEFFQKDPFFNNINYEDVLKKENLKPIWLKKLTISNFMHVEFILWNKITEKVKFDDIFSEIFLSLIIMLSSTIFFMISTENRLLSINETNINQSNGNKIKSIFEKNILNELKKNKRFIFS